VSGGWRDGRHQLAVLAAGVTAALQARGVSSRSSPSVKRRGIAAPSILARGAAIWRPPYLDSTGRSGNLCAIS